MKEFDSLPTRRNVIALLAACGTASLIAPGERSLAAPADGLARHIRDWDWLVGHWNVRHRRLKDRLVGSNEWEEFAGTCVNWPLLGGQGNVDDNVLELPSGIYRGVGVRAYDPEKEQWAIWWLDSRNPAHIDPPVYGGFSNGTGVFIGDDVFRGKPVKVRFRWSGIKADSARWDQAFSPDDGTTWEPNWYMVFTRAGK